MNFEENNFILEPTGKIKQISGLPKEITAIVKQETGYDTNPVYIPHPEGKESFLIKPLKRTISLTIFGGGHISLDLAWMAERAEFQVIVVVDRKEFAKRKRFPTAFDIRATPYKEALKDIKLDRDDFVVIVTRGHL
jgi:xanthine dehydrogenase accessory factor